MTNPNTTNANLEQNIVKTPGLGGENTRKTHLSLLNKEGEVHGTRASVSSGPRFTRTGVRSMPVSTERLAIDEGLRDSVNGLITVQSTTYKKITLELFINQTGPR